MGEGLRLLLVEDEPVTRVMLEARLRAAGHVVVAAASGGAALALLRDARFDLLLTDLHLDDFDGVALMAEARALDPEMELIVLTGGATVASLMAAVKLRAHDYILKPVAAGDLESTVATALERRRANLARANTMRLLRAALQIAEPGGPGYSVASPAGSTHHVGDLAVDVARRRASVGGRDLGLSSGEFELLRYMAERAEHVVPSEQIARAVYHHSCVGDEARELVKSRIHRLRSKLAADPRSAGMLVCVRGAGYVLTAGR